MGVLVSADVSTQLPVCVYSCSEAKAVWAGIPVKFCVYWGGGSEGER